MYISKAFLLVLFSIAVFFAFSWLFAYMRAAKICDTCGELKEEDTKLRLRINRLTHDVEKQKARLRELDSILPQIGSALTRVDTPLGTLRQIYDVLEKQDKSLVMNSPLAFIDRHGKKAHTVSNDESAEVFHRIKKSMGA